MTLKINLKFLQDNTLECEVINIYTPLNIKGKKQSKKIDIEKNGKLFTYDYDCFQKSFSNSINLKTKSFKIL